MIFRFHLSFQESYLLALASFKNLSFPELRCKCLTTQNPGSTKAASTQKLMQNCLNWIWSYHFSGISFDDQKENSSLCIQSAMWILRDPWDPHPGSASLLIPLGHPNKAPFSSMAIKSQVTCWCIAWPPELYVSSDVTKVNHIFSEKTLPKSPKKKVNSYISLLESFYSNFPIFWRPSSSRLPQSDGFLPSIMAITPTPWFEL